MLSELKAFSYTNKLLDIQYRLTCLRKLKDTIVKYTSELEEALRIDLNKSEFEAYSTEILMCLNELDYFIKNLKKLSKDQRVHTSLLNFHSKGYIRRNPYGCVLIIAPWNYPVQLTLVPLIGAIAMGNTVVLKPSEYAPKSSEVIKTIITGVFPNNHVLMVEGGKEITTQLLKEPFDLIFFTGSTNVGKIVSSAAAKTLTPAILELGGKSPTIVSDKANLQLAAKRIVWGKFINAGQTCVAPDYLLIHESVYASFKEQLLKYIKEFYYQDNKLNNDFTRIISLKHFQRLNTLLENSKIIFGGNSDEAKLTIEPTIIEDVNSTDLIMQEEIFGPILPLLVYQDLDEVLERLKKLPKPLALYLFSEDKNEISKVIKQSHSGGVAINDVLMHVAETNLPFGGIGESGSGRYHGLYSANAFSYQRSILKKSTKIDISFKYPPYRYTKYLKKWFK